MYLFFLKNQYFYMDFKKFTKYYMTIATSVSLRQWLISFGSQASSITPNLVSLETNLHTKIYLTNYIITKVVNYI